MILLNIIRLLIIYINDKWFYSLLSNAILFYFISKSVGADALLQNNEKGL